MGAFAHAWTFQSQSETRMAPKVMRSCIGFAMKERSLSRLKPGIFEK
jgi:hypothetical protein